MRLEELLERDMVDRLSVINHNADVSRVVYTIESTETPDAFSYVGAQSLVITTGMVYQKNQEELCNLIRTLNKKPVAGLGIKLGRFLNQLDPKVIETADELSFPLILIPKDKTLGEVYHNLLSILWNNQNVELLEALNLKRKLYDLVINGATLERILNNTSKTIKKSIVVVDVFGEICGKGNANRELVKEAGQYVFRNRQELMNISHVHESKLGERYQFVYPIRSISGNTHYLLTYCDQEVMDVSSFVMEEIVLLLQVIFYKNLFTDYADIQMRSDLLKQLVNLNVSDEGCSLSQIFFKGRRFGLKVSSDYYLIVGRYVDLFPYRFSEAQFMHREEKYIMGFNMLKRTLSHRYGDSALLLADMENWQYVILMQNPYEDVVERLGIVADEIQGILREKIVFSIGEKVYGIASIGNSYWKIKEKFDLLKNTVIEEKVLNFQPLSATELLKTISQRQSELVCAEVLKELAYPDNEGDLELRRTLKTFLECRGSIVETANRLYVHRNTIRYRIKKCESIIGQELDDSNICFEVQLALNLSEPENISEAQKEDMQ